MTFLECEMTAVVWSFEHSLALPFFGIGMKLDLQFQHQSLYSGLISFKIDWFDLLAVKGTLRSLFQHHISKA